MSLLGGSDDKESTCQAGDPGSIPGLGRSMEKEMATHSSVLAWKIPWTEEPGRLQSMGATKSLTWLSDWYSDLNDVNVHQLRGQKMCAQLPVNPATWEKSSKHFMLSFITKLNPIFSRVETKNAFSVQHSTVFIKRELQADHSLFHIAGLPFVSLRTFQWNREKMRIVLNHLLCKMIFCCCSVAKLCLTWTN